jgi:hypothetical protein
VVDAQISTVSLPQRCEHACWRKNTSATLAAEAKHYGKLGNAEAD